MALPTLSTGCQNWCYNLISPPRSWTRDLHQVSALSQALEEKECNNKWLLNVFILANISSSNSFPAVSITFTARFLEQQQRRTNVFLNVLLTPNLLHSPSYKQSRCFQTSDGISVWLQETFQFVKVMGQRRSGRRRSDTPSGHWQMLLSLTELLISKF